MFIVANKNIEGASMPGKRLNINSSRILFYGLCLMCLSFCSVATADSVEHALLTFHTKMAALGNAESMYNLGTMYEEGLLVDKNLDTALQWYKQAAEKGYAKAKDKIIELTAAIENPSSAKTRQKARPKREVSNVRARQREIEQTQLELDRVRKLKELEASLKRTIEKQKAETEKASQLHEQLEQERILAEEARKQAEQARLLKEQLENEVAAAEKAKREAEKARQITEQLRKEQQEKEAKSEVSEQAQIVESKPPTESKGESESDTGFKAANPCDSPVARFMSTCN